MSKTVLGLMLGIAIRDGHIKSVDDPVADYIQEWKNDARGKISIKNLLQMSGGLAQISNSYEITLKNPAVFQHFGTDFAGPVLALPLMEKPGTRWEYNNNEANLLGIILERASGRRYAEYLSKALWQPAGLADSSLYMDRPGGMPMFSCCILSRPMDWLKLGILVMQRGNLEGNQVVPENWIQDMITPSGPNKGYGYQIWLGDHAVAPERPEPHYPNQHWSSEPYADPETIVFRGFGYQRVWIMPSRNLIIVRAGRAWPAKWDNTAIPNVVYHGSR